MKFGLIEIGSTSTKAYLYDDGKMTDLGLKHIKFKDNYSANGYLLESDIDALISFVGEIQKQADDVYAFGTSIFRKISPDERDAFARRLRDVHVEFKVVSADDEADYTVRGVIETIDYQGKMAVVIGGGGSTEIVTVKNKKIINKISLDFGAVDITDKFPELKGDRVATGFIEILDYANSLVGDLHDSADVLVIAGGDHIHFYQNAGYKMGKNTIYHDDNQPYLLDFDTANYYDVDILGKSLDAIKRQDPGDAGWWDNARGMRFCMNAVARKLQSKYIIPTRINMLIGMAAEISKERRAQG